MKFTYQSSAIVFVNWIEKNRYPMWVKVGNFSKFSNCYGGENAHHKATVRLLIEESGLLYTKELGSFVRMMERFYLTPEYVRFKASLKGLTIEEAIFE